MNPDPTEVARQKWNKRHSIKLPKGIDELVEPTPKARPLPTPSESNPPHWYSMDDTQPMKPATLNE